MVVRAVVDLHPDTLKFLRYRGGLGDGAYHHGQYLAARAFKYGVTRDPRDLAALESAHPSGARVASGLASQVGAPGSDDAAELMEQAILEARTLAQVRQVAGR